MRMWSYFMVFLMGFMSVLHAELHRKVKKVEGYDLPVINEGVAKAVSALFNRPDAITGKFIPSIGWIAVRNASDERAAHMNGPKGFISRNPTWTIHFCGNTEKDQFMDQTYANTSLLWAYHILNPAIGTAKAELWRLAVLYRYGGMYLDDDANLAVPLDQIVRKEDKFIIGKSPCPCCCFCVLCVGGESGCV